MLCTFCGTENRAEYKFCGTCGVRLERRQVERRTHHGGVSTKCTGCGYLNEPGLKFCGMCGTRIERRMQERRADAGGQRAAAVANAQLPSPDVRGRVTTQVIEPPEPVNAARGVVHSKSQDVAASLPRRGEAAIFRDEPGHKDLGTGTNISGPSFLGLNSHTENEGEYLLEDEPSGGGLRRLVLLVILAAILGLVFVQWRSSFRANPKPVPAKTDPSSAPGPVPQGSNQPQGPAAGEETAKSDKSSDTTVNADSGATASDPKTAKDPKIKDPKAKDQKTEPAAQPGESDNSSVPAAAAAEVSADKKTTGEPAPPATDSKPPEEARIPDYKPSAALLRAQQYIRGHGVPQNCEQGLLYLHAATDKNDPGAAIQMAALYSSGLCVKQDRVMAYRWFNSAHELQPGNMYIQKNMDQLWAQMTSQERRLAGY